MQRTELRRLQEAELNILKDFDEYCRQQGLQYYLIGGALLGAERYGGFIPWDDDIDVAMPREDYERLQELWKTTGLESCFLQSGKTDERFSRGILKIRRNGTHISEKTSRHIPMHDGICIDIFPIDYLSSACRAKIALRAGMIRRLLSLRGIKNDYDNGRYMGLKRIIKTVLVPIGNECFDAGIERLCRKENHGDRRFAVLFLHNYSWEKQLHPWTVFGRGGICSFEGSAFSAPADAKGFLETVFGEDYMQEPGRERQVPPHHYCSVVFEEENGDAG